jgi:hypothetical protein
VSKLLKLLRLSSRDWRVLIQALVLLPLIALALRLTGLRRSQQVLLRFVSRRFALKTRQTETKLAEARRISRLVGVATRHGVYPATCLPRSLVLWFLLRREGIEGALCLGTRKEAGRFEAHAWIELAGVVLNDSEDVRLRYAAFDHAVIFKLPHFTKE